jgi:D-aminoacyl-tRNA deacylase
MDLLKFQEYDFIIFASRHSSAKKEKTLSIHVPGNFGEANKEMGGDSNNVCLSSALFNKQLFENLNESAIEHDLNKKYKITLECTHHGPFIQKPCIFVEIGATPIEWSDRRAGFVVAKAIKRTIENFRENPYNEVAIGIGGPHYCPGFNNIQLYSNVAISHVIPEYIVPITEKMILEAIKKTDEEIDFALIDWKGLKGEERKNVLEILSKNHIYHKKTSEIKK